MKVREVLKVLLRDGWFRVDSKRGLRQFNIRRSWDALPSLEMQGTNCRPELLIAFSNRPGCRGNVSQ